MSGGGSRSSDEVLRLPDFGLPPPDERSFRGSSQRLKDVLASGGRSPPLPRQRDWQWRLLSVRGGRCTLCTAREVLRVICLQLDWESVHARSIEDILGNLRRLAESSVFEGAIEGNRVGAVQTDRLQEQEW